MNCDQVFAILTRGPFPSGDATDGAVEAHLNHCSECRHFAGALRPDCGTDVESLIPEESRGLPYYWGLAASSGGKQGGALTATENYRRTRRLNKQSFFERHEPLAHLNGWQLAFAVLMGALLGTLLRVLGSADGDTARNDVAASVVPPAVVAESRATRNDEPQDMSSRGLRAIGNFEEPLMRIIESPDSTQTPIQRELAAKLGSIPFCCERQLQGIGAQPSRNTSASGVRQVAGSDACCTMCHNASATRFALRGTIPKIVRSCQVCHEDRVTSRFSSAGRMDRGADP